MVSQWRLAAILFVLVLTLGFGFAAVAARQSQAAQSKAGDCGAFSVLGLTGKRDVTLRTSQVPARFLVKGKYVEFTIVGSTFGIENYTFTGARNSLDMTGGRRTVVFASKKPDHRGLSLTGEVRIKLSGEKLDIRRVGPGLSMKIQANDCAAGGIFQMEPARADATATRITHTLAGGIFYLDNPNFRAREGAVVPFMNTTLTITPRINFANDLSPKFVGRDSAQVASRVLQGCVNTVPAPRRPGGTATVDHCGSASVWSVASGGRMGAVFGEDATEVSPAATDCVENCQALNQVQGRAALLGFPFRVPAASRLQPRFPDGWVQPPPPPAPTQCRVPNVRGMMLGAAQQTVARRHCKVGKISRKTSRLPAGRVISQSPPAGRTLLFGGKVALVLSRRA